MSFAALNAAAHARLYARLGEAAVFTPEGGTAVATQALLDPQTLVQGELGQMLDARPSVGLLKAVAGEHRRGRVQIGSRVWTLDRLISDDGDEVRFFVK